MGNSEDKIKQWLDGTMSSQEKELFEKTDEFRTLEKLLKSLDYFKAPEYDMQAGFRNLNLGEPLKARKTIMYMLRPVLRAAAVVIAVIGVWFFYKYNSRDVIKTGIAEKVELVLPDSSRVTVNASSRLAYNKGRWKNNRKIKLEGEAFFKVVKGSKFEVGTSGGIITVLGTQFNVKARDNYFEVGCYEGLVRVQSSAEDVKLTSNQMFRVLDGTGMMIQIQNEDTPGWLRSESSFQSVPFKEVLLEFERQYNIKFKTKEIEQEKLFTGRFTHSDMTLALKSICIPFNLSHEKTEDNYIILSPDSE